MSMRKPLVAALMLAMSASVWAAEYLMEGVDPARTGWMKDEKVFTTANVGSSKLLWKVKLDSAPREMHNLFSPLIAEGVTTAQGPKEIALVAGVSDDLFALDAATGQTIWKRHFDSSMQMPGRGGGVLCPGGQTAVPVLSRRAPGQYTIYAVSWDGRLRQLNLADGQDTAPPERFMPGNGKPYALTLVNGVIYTASAQGCGGVPNAFYTFDLKTRRTSTFNAAGGGMWGRRGATVAPDGTVYLGTGDATYNPTSRSIGNAIVAAKLDATGQLQLTDYFAAPNANWLWRRDLDVNTTPIAFDLQNRKFLVGTSKECRLWLLDRDTLGGDDHRTSLFTTPLLCNDTAQFDGRGIWGAMAAWQNGAQQWLAVPFWGPVSKDFKAPTEHSRPKGGGVAAYRVEQRSGKWQLSPVWLSRDMDLAEEVIIANGIAFAYGAGEDATQVVQDSAWNEPAGTRYGGGLDSGAPRRIPGSRRSTIYALDAQTGKELWSSGNEITSWNHFSGLTVANGRVYLGTFDGMMYAFGVAK